MRAPAVLHRKTLERGGAQVMSYSRAGTGRISIIYCISNTDISSAKKLHLPPLSLQKGVLTNSFQETEASCTSRCPAASLCFQVPFLREKCSWQILPFPYSDNFTELNKKTVWKIQAFFSCMLCSCSEQGWQLTAGCDTLMVHSECGSQENGSSLRQTCCCSRSAYSSFSTALSPARGCNLTQEFIIFVLWQARPELKLWNWNSGCRLAPLLPFPGLGEQSSCAPMATPISRHFIAAKMPIIRNSGSL